MGNEIANPEEFRRPISGEKPGPIAGLLPAKLDLSSAMINTYGKDCETIRGGDSALWIEIDTNHNRAVS